MTKNLKVDIIYYNTPSDFEFEFNLGGYCRSRILNAKASDIKEVITKLAIAVTRSRVIIIVGDLLGENGVIAPVAKAISKELVSIDHRQYHITTPGQIQLMEGSLPLVSSDGEFGGCIIESGPQSIVFLSENKSLRNRITTQLVSHYITSLSRTPDTENDIIVPEDTVSSEQNEIISNEDIETNSTEQDQIISDLESDFNENDNILEFTQEESVADLTSQEEFDTDFDDDDSAIIDFSQIDENENEEVADDFESFIIPLIPTNQGYGDIDEDLEILSGKYETDERPSNETLNLKNQNTAKKEKVSVVSPLPSFAKTSTNTSKSNAKKSKRIKTAFLSLIALLLIVLAILAYLTIYLPKINGITVKSFFESLFAFGGNLWFIL